MNIERAQRWPTRMRYMNYSPIESRAGSGAGRPASAPHPVCLAPRRTRRRLGLGQEVKLYFVVSACVA